MDLDADVPPRPRRVPRRTALATSALGLTSIALPTAAAATSDSQVASWTGDLTFSGVTTTGMTVSWDEV